MTTPAIVVGVDVAKDRLDVAVRPSDETWSAANDDAGITALVTRLRPLGPALIVCEATGGFERAAIAGCRGAAGRSRAPPPGAGLCPGDGPAGQDRSARCDDPGAVC